VEQARLELASSDLRVQTCIAPGTRRPSRGYRKRRSWLDPASGAFCLGWSDGFLPFANCVLDYSAQEFLITRRERTDEFIMPTYNRSNVGLVSDGDFSREVAGLLPTD
jgi:hypothetical protein